MCAINVVEEEDSRMPARVVRYLVIHCSEAHAGDAETPLYHFVIARDGRVRQNLPFGMNGIHASGFNRCSIGVCYEGGTGTNGLPKDTRTVCQCHAIEDLVRSMQRVFPGIRVVGHSQLRAYEGVNVCPCF